MKAGEKNCEENSITQIKMVEKREENQCRHLATEDRTFAVDLAKKVW